MERGAGNPLFLRELASVGEKSDDAEDLPETVEALVATRIDQLAPGDRALLRWASVLGVSFSGVADCRGARGRLRRCGRLGGVGPARRVRRARSGRGRRLPLPARAHPRRGVRGALVSSGGANSTAASPRSSSSARASGPRRRQSSSRCTTSTPVAGAEAWTYSRLAGDLAREVYANVDAAQFLRARARGERERVETSTTASSRARGARSARSVTQRVTTAERWRR